MTSREWTKADPEWCLIETVVYSMTIEEAIQMRVSSPKDFVTLFGEAFEKIAPGQSLASPNIFGTHEMKDRIKIGATNQEVLDVIRKAAEGAIDNTFNILRTRIDRFGVAQPNIRKADISGRIIIELPGINDPQRVRELLQGTAALEFYETYDNPVFSQYLDAADQKVKQVLDAEAAVQKDTIPATEIVPAEEAKAEGSDSDLLKDITGNSNDSLANASLEDLQKRFPLLSRLIPARTQNGQAYPGSTVGYALPKDTALINKFLRMPQVRAVLPRDARLMWEMQAGENGYVSLHAIKITTRNGKAPLEGDAVVNAKQDYDQNGRPVVSMQMNSEGTKTWARLTKENIKAIAALALANIEKRLVDRGIKLKLTPQADQWIVDNGYDEVYGARPLKRLLKKELENKLAYALLSDTIHDNSEVTVDVGKDGLEVTE